MYRNDHDATCLLQKASAFVPDLVHDLAIALQGNSVTVLLHLSNLLQLSLSLSSVPRIHAKAVYIYVITDWAAIRCPLVHRRRESSRGWQARRPGGTPAGRDSPDKKALQ